MSKNYYISDYHFYHELALRRSRNQFTSVIEMNDFIIQNHNRKVLKDDHVYILGDVIVCDENELEEKMKNTVSKLNGILHLVIGNHDYKYINNNNFTKHFASVDEAKLIKDGNKWVQLCHYPFILWYRKNKGSYHVFGHVHNENVSKEYNILKNEDNALNACVEINNYEPCTLDELIVNNSKWYDR